MSENLGLITKEADGFKVVFERTLAHDIHTVWDAITNPEKLKLWFTDFELEYKAGGLIKIKFRDEANTVTHGQVLRIEPPHKFAWTWEGELAVWELFELNAHSCKLKLTYSKLSDAYAVGASGGFHTLLDRLESMLQGNSGTYPFGTEEHDPAQAALREVYGKATYDTFPELEVHHPVALQRVYEAPIAKVWEAITDKSQLKQWYFDFSEQFELEVGHVFDWWAGPPDGKQWHHRGEITEVVPQKKLAHTWEFPGYVGKAKLLWELTAVDANHTRLDFRFDILVPFDPKEDALRRKHFVEGWNHIINIGLAEYLHVRKGQDIQP